MVQNLMLTSENSHIIQDIFDYIYYPKIEFRISEKITILPDRADRQQLKVFLQLLHIILFNKFTSILQHSENNHLNFETYYHFSSVLFCW